MNTASADPAMTLRSAIACGAATLVLYVGIVHELVGTQLYPDGPAELGGWLGWHGVGLSGIAAGLLLWAGVLRWLRVPIVPLAAAVGVIGAVVLAETALRKSSFHFFAFTLVVATVALILAERSGSTNARHPLSPP